MTSKTPPHWRISLAKSDSIYSNLVELYQGKLLTPKGALFGYFKIRIKEGWRIKTKPKELMDLFGMSRSTLWRALNELRDAEVIDFSDLKEITVSLNPSHFDPKSETGIPEMGHHPRNGTPSQK